MNVRIASAVGTHQVEWMPERKALCKELFLTSMVVPYAPTRNTGQGFAVEHT